MLWTGLIVTTYLQFSDGSKHKIINPYMIQPFKNKYLKTNASIITDEGVIDASLSDYCEGCGKSFEDQPVRHKFLSEDMELNKKFGRAARICVVCFYRPYHEKGMVIPPPLRSYF